MRPLEISVAVSCLLVLSVSYLRLPRYVRDLSFIAAMVLLIVQISMEGFRLQMLLLYVLMLWSMLDMRFAVQKHSPTFLRVGARALLWLAAIALPVLMPVFQLAKPSGPYSVGTVQYDWTDARREELLTADPSDQRRLVVQLWYPAEVNQASRGSKAAYVPEAKKLGEVLWQTYHIPAQATSYLHYIKTSSDLNAPVSEQQSSYPVIIYSHGLPGTRYSATQQMEELASHGYIVAAVQHTYYAWTTVFSDGTAVGQTKNKPAWTDLPGWDRVIEDWVEDDRFVLDRLLELNRQDPEGRLTGKMKVESIGIAGHSFGGAAAVKALQVEPRLKAAANLDGTPFGSSYEGGLPKPVLYMNTGGQTAGGAAAPTDAQLEKQGVTKEAYERFMKEIPRRTENIVSGGGYVVTLQGLKHMSFTDYYLWSPLLRYMDRLPESPRASQSKMNAVLVEFYGKHLLGEDAPILDGEAAAATGVQVRRIPTRM
jgi:predicted dienelactone hydrolase